MTDASTAGETTNRRLDPEQRRAQLVASGLRLLKTGPLDAVTAPAVAAEAGVSKGLVFHYFPTQRDLQAAIANAAADELLAMISGIDPGLDHLAQLRAGLEGFIDYIEQQPASFAAIARDAGGDDLLRGVVERTREAIVETVCRVVGLDQPTPRMRLLLRGWMAMVEEATIQWVIHRPFGHDELVDELQATAFDLVARAVTSGSGVTGSATG